MANHSNSAFNKSGEFYCQYCNKICHNLNSLKQHECRCKENTNRITTTFIDANPSKVNGAWNKGLTAEDPRVQKQQETYKSNKKLGKHKIQGHPQTEEFKQKQRKRALERHLGGFNMRRGIYYNGIKLDSSYEVVVAENLDKNNIKWVRPGRFQYHMDNKLHYYTPDFYLPDYNIYLDPKNDYLINNINEKLGFSDVDKIHQVELENNIKVLILNKDQLDWEIIKTLLL